MSEIQKKRFAWKVSQWALWHLGVQYHISFSPAGLNEYSLSGGKELHPKVADNSFLLELLTDMGFISLEFELFSQSP